MRYLKGNRVVLGVTGSIAAYKSAELLRLMVKAGFNVSVVMTVEAQSFISPLTLATISGEKVLLNEFSDDAYKIPHIQEARNSDIIVIAPATARIISELACGRADKLLTAMVLAAGDTPVLIAPAMNSAMWAHPATQGNVSTLLSYGYHFVGPAKGELACGGEGSGRLVDLPIIMEEIFYLLHREKALDGKRVLVTASRTIEAIDPVRYISNYSSGKMGYWLARVARRWGADVTLISGPSELSPPYGVKFVNVESASDMKEAVLDHFDSIDILFMAAAVADFRPVHKYDHKIKKEDSGALLLRLEPTVDILGEIALRKGNKVVVGFAAESDNLVENALQKMRKKNMDIIVANEIAGDFSAFGSDFNEVTVILKDGSSYVSGRVTKEEVAEFVIDKVVRLL